MPPSKANKGDARGYQSWAGWFLDPAKDPELCATLPGWKQRTNKLRRPVSYAENRRAHIGNSTDVSISIPAGFDRQTVGGLVIAAPAALEAAFRERLTFDDVLSECSENGEGYKLRRVRPDAEPHAFVWLLALVRGGKLSAISLEQIYEAEEGIERLCGHPVSLLHPSAAAIKGWIDTMAAQLYMQVVL